MGTIRYRHFHLLSCWFLRWVLGCVGVQGWLVEMVCGSSFAIIGAALEAHVHEAARRGWALPTQLPKGTAPLLPLSICLSVCPSIRLSVHLSVCACQP